MKIKDRIKELRRVPAHDLRPNPKNWRTHSPQQQDALRGILAEVGFAGAVLARELEDGSLMLIDGHLRAETTPDELLPVLVLDVDEAEADLLLASFDTIGDMAGADKVKLEELMTDISTGSDALQEMLSKLAEDNGIIPADEVTGPEEFPTVDENIETDFCCPKCGYAWSGKQA